MTSRTQRAFDHGREAALALDDLKHAWREVQGLYKKQRDFSALREAFLQGFAAGQKELKISSNYYEDIK